MICTHISSFGAKFDQKSRNLENSYFQRDSVTPLSRCDGRPAGRSATSICHARKKCFSQNRCFMKDVDLKLHSASSFDDMHPISSFGAQFDQKSRLYSLCIAAVYYIVYVYRCRKPAGWPPPCVTLGLSRFKKKRIWWAYFSACNLRGKHRTQSFAVRVVLLV